MLDVRRLRVLAAVDATGSFSAAAQSLALTQSAVSQHIAALERAVGLPLVERGSRPVQLTDAGFALSRHAAGIFTRLEAAEQELAEIAGRRHGRLRFGCFPTMLATLMPPAFARFRTQHPDVRLIVVDDHLHRLLPRLDAGELDLAIIYDHDALGDVGARDLLRTPLIEDRFQAVLPTAHPLAQRSSPLHLRELRNESWIGGATNSAWYRIVRHACTQAGFTPAAAFASDDYIAVRPSSQQDWAYRSSPASPSPIHSPASVRQLASGAPTRRISAASLPDGYQGPAFTTMIESLCSAAQRWA